MKIFQVSALHLSDIATLPWDIFQQYYSNILLITYVIAEENEQ